MALLSHYKDISSAKSPRISVPRVDKSITWGFLKGPVKDKTLFVEWDLPYTTQNSTFFTSKLTLVWAQTMLEN